MYINQKCRYFKTDMPCIYHKNDNDVVCEKCRYYRKRDKKIIIIKLGAMGDVLRTTCILKPIYKKYKNPDIYWVTKKESIPMLENNSYIKEIMDADKTWQLINEKFDVLINLDLDKEALRISGLLDADEKIGFYYNENIICSNKYAAQWFELSHNDNLKKKNKITYQKYMFNILGLNYRDDKLIFNLKDSEKKFAVRFAEKNNIKKRDKVIGINTGAGVRWKKKSWSEDYTAELINMLTANGYKVLIFGGKGEKIRNKRILSYIDSKDKVVDTGTDNSIIEFGALLSLCNLVVTTDSLCLHISAALGKKIIALFGPTSKAEIELYNHGKKISSNIKCLCCYKKDCSVKPDCMDLIKPKRVFNEIKRISSLPKKSATKAQRHEGR